jgi:hypothetical protein
MRNCWSSDGEFSTGKGGVAMLSEARPGSCATARVHPIRQKGGCALYHYHIHACSLNHIALVSLNSNNWHSHELDMGGQSQGVHRTPQLFRSSPRTSGVRSTPFLLSFILTSEGRRILRDIPPRRLARPLPRHFARAIRRQQRRTAVQGLREDERMGIRACGEAWPCIMHGRLMTRSWCVSSSPTRS